MVLVEREVPLQRVSEALERARRGKGGTLLLSGEAGIGKSALIEHVAKTGAAGWRVLRGGCEDLLSPRPLGPLSDIARTHALRFAEPPQDAASTDAVFAAFLDFLAANRNGSLLIFEDLHWADQATLDLCKYLARRITGLPVVLLLSFRDDELGARPALQQMLNDLPPWSVTRVPLQPLSPEAVAELAAQAGRPAAGLHEATAGNPFYLTEVLASGVVDAHQGVPSTVREAVHFRVARLGAAERAVLEALCAVPGPVEFGLLQALLPQSAAPVESCLAHGVLVAQRGALAFRHELARRALLDEMPPARRRQAHARVLAALSGPFTAHDAVAPALSRLMHHATEAGDAQRLLELAPPAAKEAAAVGAHREAALHLAAALRVADQAAPALRAQLYESWSYEAGLSLAIDAQVIDARHQAIALWQQLGRLDKVGLNLRWLSRLHWYRGESVLAERYAEQAVATLEPLAPGPELAWAYSVRSQFYMLQDRTDLAVLWGERASALAEQLGEDEILCHALNNIGTAELFAGRDGGRQKLERSLAIALAGGFHEQAARVYTNMSEHAVVFKDYAVAEHWISEGIAFDRAHDLDAWTHYLVGWQAQLRLEQGRFDEAERIAREVLATPRLTAVMRLPAMTVLARVRMRRGAADALRLIDEALTIALPTGEAQRIAPLVTAQAEAAWLRGDGVACAAALRPLLQQQGVGVNAWEAGEVAAWQRRAGPRTPPSLTPTYAAGPWRLEIEGDPAAAAQAWLALGAPNEAALALIQAALAGAAEQAAPALTQALEIALRIGAVAAAARVRSLAAARGLQVERIGALPTHRAPARARASRPAAHGLSAREQQVLGHLAAGLNDAEIARRLGVARRTAEHHVAAVLGKLAVGNRGQAVARAREQGLLPSAP